MTSISSLINHSKKKLYSTFLEYDFWSRAKLEVLNLDMLGKKKNNILKIWYIWYTLIIPYSSIQSYTVNHTVLNHTVNHTVPYSSIQLTIQLTIQFHTVNHTVPYSSIQFHTAPYIQNSAITGGVTISTSNYRSN